MNKKQLDFLRALLTESTVSKAIKTAKISRATAYRYLSDKEFTHELNSRRSECIDGTVRYLQSNLSLCSEELIKIINDKSTPQQIKINAINTVFSVCKNLIETVEIVDRLQKIEDTITGDNDEY